MTRGSEPGTATSRVHSSATPSSPSARAATAGNSASRSSVSVKMQLTISSARSSLRRISSRISSVVAARIASASLALTLLAPRSAKSRMAAGFCQRPHRPAGRVDLVNARAPEAPYRDRDGGKYGRHVTADLAVREHEPRAAQLDDGPGGFGRERSIEQVLDKPGAGRAMGLGPQAVADERPPPRLRGDDRSQVKAGDHASPRRVRGEVAQRVPLVA